MTNYLPILLSLLIANQGHGQISLQYVFQNEKIRFYDISVYNNVQIGAGQFDPCSFAYICAITDNNQGKWERKFDFLNYSRFTDIHQIDDRTFLAVGEEWLADDIQSLLSIFIAKMDIDGKLLFFKKFTDPQILNNQDFHVNCKIRELPNRDLVISAGKQLVYLTPDASVYKYVTVNNKIIDFEPVGQDEFYYNSYTSLFHYDQLKLEEIVLKGYQQLSSFKIYNNDIYFNENNKLYQSDLNGQSVITISDSIGCKYVMEYKIRNDTFYVVGNDFSDTGQLFIFDPKNKSTTTTSLEDIKRVTFNHLDVNDNGILISGYCAYGKSNAYFINTDHNYNLPKLTKDLAISNLKQTEYKREVDTLTGGTLIYHHYFTFEYTISNLGTGLISTFSVYSEDFFHINCYSDYYSYTHMEELFPGASVTLTLTGQIIYIGSPTIGICLKVAAPDLELDKNPEDNINCRTLVGNDDPINSNTSFQLIPNPADDVVHIKSEQSGDFRIYNSTGILIDELKNINNFELNIKEFEAGIYFIKHTAGNQQDLTKKLIKL